ncbi:hypothetical protein DSC45_22350 [Streptomyces sp. YIM 130001]|uniref:hypothetical protein n=1 Tax=Streptomyces sp. YIM 130001 TaxID=2259644 RepID=UPI000E657BD4|nr:hypothetical protein [Streptomyces sp. YIM 130001]RII13697.1 hypothetical protein DSC45_22350 [Streptomyces sp. YIM 130001]
MTPDRTPRKPYSPVEIQAQEQARKGLLLILDSRGIDVPEDVRRRILGCQDLKVLRTWLTRAATAPTAAAVTADAGNEA